MYTALIDIAYLVAAILFIFGLKRLQSPATARRGNQLAALGMLIAVVATLFLHDILTPVEMVGGLVLGSAIGAVLARKVEMTGMPELVAAFNGFGGLASALVAAAEVAKFITQHGEPAGVGETFDLVMALTIGLSVLIGMVTFSGSFVAFGKLSGKVSGNPIAFPGMRVLTVLLAVGALAGIGYMMYGAADFPAVTEPVVYGTAGLMGVALLLGILLVIPIGGADMPVVVALLNSYSGLAAAATGFVLDNTALIISGALVGASGLILTNIMCVAMNRSLLNVLLGGFGGEAALEGGGPAAALEGKTVNSTSPEDAAILLSYARQVIIVPGYGMAVAQAQHQVRELAELLQEKGVTVKFAIHPVAGRMPGHMNVLLAEANVPYDQLFEMDEINGEFDNTDVALVIGANDVVNPAARHDKSSPIYGMPILNVDHARTVIVMKRSLRPGYAGVDNELFYKENTQMLFGDAKESLTKLIAEVKALS
ncbi:MAG: NAD(P) transhydrogenase subunit beta [Rhodothermaceae bacterium]|nr:MAG: NAD(P)(+) transhydrogenase (Re/Si-specific) subunit beta [Bacteroidota bacterium]GIV61270.1 MAG: NAD(P) transhydrogenase subunit beta [Rhodothermaceae bacterium]